MFINSVRQPVKILVKKTHQKKHRDQVIECAAICLSIRTADTWVSLLLLAIKSMRQTEDKSFSAQAACCLS